MHTVRNDVPTCWPVHPPTLIIVGKHMEFITLIIFFFSAHSYDYNQMRTEDEGENNQRGSENKNGKDTISTCTESVVISKMDMVWN